MRWLRRSAKGGSRPSAPTDQRTTSTCIYGAIGPAEGNLDKITIISGEQGVNIGSQDMDDEVWLKLAKRPGEVVKSRTTDAVIITHGTETMEKTGNFLDLVMKTDKPIVMVGSIRPAIAISAGVGDGNMTGPALDRVTAAANAGVVVVRSSRLASGIAYRNNDVDDDKLRLGASDELNPPK